MKSDEANTTQDNAEESSVPDTTISFVEKSTNVEAEPTKGNDAQVDSAIGENDRVQYFGESMPAYQGQSGVVKKILPSGKAAVLFDGARNPITIDPEELTSAISDEIPLADATMLSKRPRYRYIGNTYGGLLLIPDLRSDTEPEGIALQPGEKVDLLQMFTPEQINRCRSLNKLVEKKSPLNGLSFITVLDSLDDDLPHNAVVKPLIEREGIEDGSTIKAPRNQYDDQLDDIYQKEDDRNEKLKQQAGGGRRTKQHGRGSTHMGKG